MAGAGVTRYMGNHPLAAGMAGTLVAAAMAGLTLLTSGMGRVDALDHAQSTSPNLVSGQSVVQSDGETVAVTESVGCATRVPADGENALDPLAAADRQRYAAKAGGRNRISAAQWAARSMARDSSA